jgi:hypothetical protein
MRSPSPAEGGAAAPSPGRIRLARMAGAVVAAAFTGVAAAVVLGATPGGAPQASAADTTPTTTCGTVYPDTMTASGGTPQTTKVGTAFPTPMSVQLSSSGGCPANSGLAGVSVTFTAPSSGASGTFSNTGTNTVTVGTNSQGAATAPTFTANDTTGSYTVIASSTYGSVSFSLTNANAGVAATITPFSGSGQTATVGSAYGYPLDAQVVDPNGNPVQGATVTFSAPGGTNPGATFAGGGSTATEATGSNGVAVSPPLTANTVAGTFTVTASTAGVSSPASFSLENLAGSPNALTAGSGSSQATPVNTSFPVPLSVTVTDSYKNPVPGASVTFTAPASGAGGTFAGGGTTVVVATDSSGVAVAPTFTANGTPGGYIVTASVSGVSSSAAFSLVNQAPGAGSTGYWLVASDGGVFSYGTAGFYGSAGSIPLRAPVVGMASTPDGRGYWLVASDGGVFTYGDAGFYGSAGSLPLSAPVSAMAPSPDGAGYWLVAADGGVFGYGSAGYHGSAASSGDRQVRGLAAGPGGSGYWLADAGGIVYGYGDAPVVGSPAGSGTVLASPIVGIAAPG